LEQAAQQRQEQAPRQAVADRLAQVQYLALLLPLAVVAEVHIPELMFPQQQTAAPAALAVVEAYQRPLLLDNRGEQATRHPYLHRKAIMAVAVLMALLTTVLAAVAVLLL